MKHDPWTDKQCQTNYCKENGTDFDYFVADRFPSDYMTSNHEKFELDYCETNEDDFLEFAREYQKPDVEIDPQDKADDDNEALKERDWK